MSKVIPVRFAIVDDDDYELLCQHNWYVTGTGHVVRYENKKAIFMHRDVMGTGSGIEVDHANGIGIDNQKVNLRECSHAENMKNRKVSSVSGKSSKYKGVWRTRHGTWSAEIYSDNKRYSLGSYKIEEVAAKVYDAAARYYHKEFAKTNFPGNVAMSAEEIFCLRESGKLEL